MSNNAGKTVAEILQEKKASIRNALSKKGLPAGMTSLP
jgi:hypothetical protein